MSSKKTFKDFLIHIGLILLSFLVLLYVFFYIYLPKNTHHGEAIEVPDLKGVNLDEVQQIIVEKNLRYIVFDSSYAPEYKSRSVISQFPKAGEFVKSNRAIYISISTVTPPLVKMPKLVDNSLKAAEMSLKSYGLVLGEIKYISHPNLGAVLKQSRDGAAIEPGTMIQKGTVINLLVSSGLGDAEIPVPSLVGMNIEDAKKIAATQGLGLDIVGYDETQTTNAGTIIKQKPEYIENDSTHTLRVGEIIDVWVAGTK